MAASSRAQVLRLYRALLRESQRFGSYNYRTYAIRRIRDAFRENKNIKDSEKIEELVNKAKANLEVIHRQEAALLSWSHTCPLQHFSGGEEEQGVTPQLETVSVSVSQGLGLGCRSPVPRTGEKDEEDTSTTLYFADGLFFFDSLLDGLMVPTGSTSEGGRKSPS
ncbi:LYR motif-containing protein 4 isoform X2 [Strix aluco]|uniref:LYR motif-containing protein 4 isoform X2 n=1 Tax=Strix aluco TaxID=111821 RepID=UPI003DA42FEF